MVLATDFHPVNLASTPTGTHISHWWRQQGHPAKISPVRHAVKVLPISVVMSEPLYDVKFGHSVIKQTYLTGFFRIIRLSRYPKQKSGTKCY